MLRTIRLARAIAVAAILSTSLLVACPAAMTTTPGRRRPRRSPLATKAIDEIDETSAGLDQALTQLRSGDAKAAKETVAETYLQHFEEVEAGSRRSAPELIEKLEEGISTDLRGDIGKAWAERDQRPGEPAEGGSRDREEQARRGSPARAPRIGPRLRGAAGCGRKRRGGAE